MKVTGKLIKVGDSYAKTIPKPLLRQFNVNLNKNVDIELELLSLSESPESKSIDQKKKTSRGVD